MTFEELKTAGGYNIQMRFAKFIKRGEKEIPVDLEQKAQMWKLDNDYFWVEDEVIIQKMPNSSKSKTLDKEIERRKVLISKGLFSVRKDLIDEYVQGVIDPNEAKNYK